MNEIERLQSEIEAMQMRLEELKANERSADFIKAIKARDESYMLSLEEVAGVLDVSIGRMRNLLSDGQIKYIGSGQNIRVAFAEALKSLYANKHARHRAIFIRTLWEK